MNDPARKDPSDLTPDVPVEDDSWGLSEGLVADVRKAIKTDNIDQVRDKVVELHYAEAADLLERLKAPERAQLVQALKDDLDPTFLSELDENVLDDVVDEIGAEGVAAALTEMDTDDAVGVIEDLEADDQRDVLEALPAPERSLIEESLSYPEDSAGRLMQRELVAVPAFWTVGETIDYLRSDVDLPDDFYDLFVVDPLHKPIGTIPLGRIMRNKRPVRIGDVMNDEDFVTVSVETDQEEVTFLFRDRDIVSLPVLDMSGRLAGVITADDVIDVIDEEHEEDIMAMAGVSEDEFFGSVMETTRSRLWWLVVNLATAILASLVIGLFTDTIEQVVALAVLMPIVASMGGNAGTQTLTVAVRALAMKELTPANALQVIGKEVIVGSVNGVIFAVLVGAATWVWFGDTQLAMVIGCAMVVNMIVAGLAGASIPLLLERAGADPAVASSVFLTTVTDVIGFFAFLGLAAAFLL